MSIPDRFYRIAKHKMVEIKDWFDKVDEEEDTIASERLRTAGERTDAHRELADAMEAPPSAPSASSSRQASAPSAPRSSSSAIPLNPPRMNSLSSTYAGTRISRPPSEVNATASSSAAQSIQAPDPLEFHYKRLGVETGSDFASVQYAYNRLAARSDSARFPAGSEEEKECLEIRQRLEASFKILREALDQTARRFDLLEFDPLPPASN